MSNNVSLQQIKEFHEKLRNDPVRLKEFMRSVIGPTLKKLEGKEKEQIILLLKMVEPFKETNNQHCWTDYYMIGDVEYHATYFPDDKDGPIIEKVLPDED